MFFKRKSDSDMWLLAGLGNPGAEYEGNRHNIGFMAVDAIADRHRFPAFRAKFHGQMAEGLIAGKKAVLLKPQTFMNNSGQSIQAVARFFKIAPDRIAVFHDELDLAAGKLKVKLGGGNAGHNGLRSMDAHLGTPDYWRVRMGIGHPGDKARVHGYVLSDFAKAEKEWLEMLLKAVADHAGLIVSGDMGTFMTRVSEHTKKED